MSTFPKSDQSTVTPEKQTVAVWRWTLGSLLLLLGLVLLGGGAWTGWHAFTSESFALPPEVESRHIQERMEFVQRPIPPPSPTLDTKAYHEAEKRGDEAELQRLQEAFNKETAAWKAAWAEQQRTREAKRAALLEKQAAEVQAERVRANRQELYNAGVGVFSGLMLVVLGLAMWLTPARAVGPSTTNVDAGKPKPSAAANDGGDRVSRSS